jgi:hypothetical protein
MPDRVLQNHNCVAALQHRLSYNVIMSLSVNEQSNEEHRNEPVASTRSAAGHRRGGAWPCRAGLLVVTLLGTSVLAAACGSVSSGQVVAGHLNRTLGLTHALAFVNCMRTHGEPNMPDPAAAGNSVSISIKVGSGVNPGSAQFTAAFKACKHLAGFKGSGSGGPTITAADQADYLKAVACMRSHGFPKFPDPVFQDNNVSFTTTTPIDTNSAQYQRALATCDKLIPAGLPYSGHSPSA